jgi:manganese oxidase
MTEHSLPVLGPLAWIDFLVLGWLLLCAASLAYVAIDSRRTPEPTVMKWGWLLCTLYMGPIAAGLYVLTDKEPEPGSHEEFIRPLWRQGIGSTVHCIAGDATGIILAATVTAMLGLPMWVDIIVEYVAGFAFGWFIFQALFMKSMYNSYGQALRHSFIPEWLSMNMMMTGMILVMVPSMMGRDMRAMDPAEILYWGVMSAGIVVGFFVAYPVNVWLVNANLKHGLMTVRPEVEASHSASQPATRPAHDPGGAS